MTFDLPLWFIACLIASNMFLSAWCIKLRRANNRIFTVDKWIKFDGTGNWIDMKDARDILAKVKDTR